MDREFSLSELKKLNSNKGLISLLSREQINIDRTLRYLEYERNLKKLQVEVIKLQTWAINNNERVIFLFEGRDAAGKGGAIRRITERITLGILKLLHYRNPQKTNKLNGIFKDM